MLSHVFLPDSDAALEFDLDLRFTDNDLFDQRPHDGRVIRTHDCAVFDAERNKSISERNGTVTSGLISLFFLLFYGSSTFIHIPFPKGNRVVDPPFGNGARPEPEAVRKPLKHLDHGVCAVRFDRVDAVLHRAVRSDPVARADRAVRRRFVSGDFR